MGLIYENEKPAKIYKYVSLADGQLIISNSTLKFTKPSDFNDPFDCDIRLLQFENIGKLDQHVYDDYDELKKRFPLVPLALFLEAYEPAINEKINSTRVCCFSANESVGNILMWSHYANKHKGICLQFDNNFEKKFIDLDEEEELSEGKVNYHFDGKLNYLGGNKKDGHAWVFVNKAKEWEYEQEYRFMIIKKKEIQRFDPLFLKNIYFGVNVTNEERIDFIELCKKNNYAHVKFYLGVKQGLSLEFTEI
ncbi:hypothetical protein CAP36_14535 [Chitinophagaceae bacterium IBVUCB2]|nr:hypothetical protein CAP36_14535 [Chitinophagaceae bacterium IBVUCB2]